ncbi:MAG: thioredoxin [bacterium]
MAVMEVGDKDFEEKVLKSEKPVMVDFWAPWCMPCRMVGPIVEELSNAFEGQANFAKVNVDESPEVAARFGIRSIPTIMIFKSGECVDTIVGACPKEYFKAKVENVIGRTGVEKGD